MKPDYSKLPPELIEKLKGWEANRPENKQVQFLSDIADMVQELVTVADGTKKNTDQIKALGAVLDDARQQLVALNKKEAPEAPDYSKPVVEALAKLGKEIAKIDVQPKVNVAAPQVNVPAPNVTVSPTDVKIDLSKMEKVLKTDIPKAFQQAISQIPVPEQDDTAVLDKLDNVIDWLKSIDTASRLKPQNSSASGGGGGGDASAANQVTGNNLLTDIKANQTNGTQHTIVDNASIPVTGTFFQATQPVSGPLTDTQLRATPVPISGTVSTGGLTDTQLRASAVPVSLTSTTITGSVAVTGTFFQATQPVSLAATVITQETQPTTPTLTNVTMTGSSVTLAALNTSRRNLTIYNDTGVVVYVKFGSSASATSFTIKMVDQSYYEVPNPVYTGVVTAFGASGVVRVTEVT